MMKALMYPYKTSPTEIVDLYMIDIDDASTPTVTEPAFIDDKGYNC